MNYQKIVTSLLFTLFLGVFLCLWVLPFLERSSEGVLTKQDFYFASLKQVSKEATGAVSYIINKGEGKVIVYEIEDVVSGETVFSLLKQLSQRHGFEVESTQYDIGVFVEAIDNVKNGTDNKYWQYWVDGRLGDVAADRKKIKGIDTVEWRFESPPEFF